MNDFTKAVKSLKVSSLLIKDVSKRIANKAKEQKGVFPSLLLGSLRTILLGNLLRDKGFIWSGKETTRVGQDF